MSPLQIAVLGKPRLTYNDQPLTADLISAKGQALLIYLAVTGRAHSRTALAGLLWGDMTEETARANLRQILSKLRKFLPPDMLQTGRLEIGLDGYWLDGREFQKGLEKGDSTNLKSLLNLYRSDFLDDFYPPNAPDFDSWVEGQREYWRQTAVTRLTKWIETAVQTHDHDTGITLAQKLLTIEPWHEETHRRLMHLLARSGQRSAALAQYETCRRLLADELGVEPAAETTALYQQIRDNALNPAAEAKAAEPTPHRSPFAVHRSLPTPAPPHNLPVQLTPFIGREAELKRLVERLLHPDYRLLTLLGEGGAGKTRLALAAAEQVNAQSPPAFTGGIWFVSLVGMETADPADPRPLENNIAAAVAAALGLTFATAEPPKTQLLNYLRHKQCLLLLDNFEPLVAAAGFVLELLTAAPGVILLVTSREPLHLQAEAIVRVEGLALPETAAGPTAMTADAIQLFAERAERTTGREVVTPETLPDVLRLCRLVNSLPLGIELIASWTRWLSLPAILQGLQENAARLESNLLDVAPRHRSLQAVFDYSWALLSPAEQETLARLSVFRRAFQLDAAQEVAGALPATLFALVDKSLVQHGEEGYYALHELLRQYAAARLVEIAPDQAELYGRHAAYYLRLAGQQEAALVGSQPQAALRRMQADNENLALAWQWAAVVPLPEALALGVGGMAAYWYYAGLFAEAEQALAVAATAVSPLIDSNTPSPDLCRLMARLTTERAGLLFDLDRLDEMEKEAQAGLQWAALAGDEALMAPGRLCWGQVCWRRGEFEAAVEQLQQAQELAAATGQTILEAAAWRSLAAVAWRQGNLLLAENNCRRSLQLHEQAGDIRGENRSRHFLGILAINRHDYEAAAGYLEPMMAAARALGDRRMEAAACAESGQIAKSQGHYEMALAHFARELELAEEMGVTWQAASNAGNTGDTLLHLGDYGAAQAAYERGLARFRQLDSAMGQSHLLAFMGLLAFMEGRFEDGRSLSGTALKLAQQADARREQAFARLFLAHNLAGLGQWSEARQTYTQAQAAWQALDDPNRRLEAQAGLAQALLMLGDVAGALAAVNDSLAYLESHTPAGADDPIRVYLICHEVLSRVGDDRAEQVLADGRTFLQNRAARIHDPALRRTFLENVPSHKTLLSRHDPS